MEQKGNAQPQKQYSWILIYYHEAKAVDRVPANKWFDTLEECEADADKQDFDFCCGFQFEFEERIKPSK